MERNGRCYRVGNPALLITMFLIFSAVPSALSANIRVDFPEKLGLALASRLEKAASDERLVVWVNLKDRPELLDRAAAARWAKEHRNLPPVNEDYIRSISALPEIKYRVLDELSNRISVELPARAVNALIRLGFVVEIHEVEEGIPAKTVDNHVCPGDHYFQRWESWKQADGTFKDFWATHNLRPEMTAINIASLHSPNNYNGSGVVIGVIDSGFQRNNEVFDVVNNPNTKTSDGNNKVCAEKDFTNGAGANDDGNANTADDEIGHGTNCAGVAAGYDKNNIEYVGTAPDAKLAIAKMAYKDANGAEHWPSDMFINAVKWLVNDVANPKVDIISCSVCYWKDKDGNDITTNGYTAVTRWVDWAAKQGRVVCTAMGNDFNGNPPESSLWAPADNFNGISVGATKNDGSAITYYSRRGRTADKRLKPDVVAPGGDDTVSPGDIYNPDHYVNWVNLPCLNNNWTAACGWNEGTSFATPMVAGVIACMMEKTPALKGKPLQVRTRLWETAVDKGDAGPDTTYGFGLVDANSAADNAKPQLMIRDTANGVEWGRSTDVGFVPSCDINASVGYPTPNGIYDGFENGDDPFWTSPDIFVDNNLNNQPDNPNEPIANQLNHFKVRVTNIGDGNAAADSYRVKLYKTDPNTGMTVWTLVDTQNTTPAINAGSTGLVDLTWQTPALNDLGQTHWCMGATVEHKTNADDKAPVPGQAPTGAIPAFNTVLCDNLAIRNFYVQPPASPVVINFRVQNTTEVFGPVMLTLVPVEMPSGWTCYLSQDIFTLAPGQEAIPPPSVTVNPPTSPPTGERAIIHVQARGPTGEVLGGFGLKVYKRGAIPTPGTLMLALGPATPADHLYPTIPPDSDNEMLQMRATSGGVPAEPVRIKSITLAASGTGDDLADISAVKLWVDNNHDGIVNVGDTLLATSTYSWDNGNVKLSPAAPGYLINAGAFVDLLISYVMSGGDPGETYSFSVADVDTFGGNSGSSVTLSGLPINSCTKTIRPIPTGTLTMNKGAYSPQNHWGFLWEDNIMLQMYLAANGWENINMHTITLQANGTGNDQTDIASVKIYKDADNDGVVDAGDPLLGSGAYLLGDNTQLIIPLVTTITKSTGINILVVYSMDGGGGAGGGGCTYWCTVDSIGATGALTLNEVTKVGLPIISSVKTLGWAGPGGSQTIGQWMKEKDGTKVHLSGVVVSLGYNVLTNNIIYVQESNRSNGVMVTSPVFGIGANEGDILDIDGVIETDPLTHERRIVQPVIAKSGETDAPKPLGMNMSAVGGGMFGLYKFGRTGGGGLNNVGLLAKLWGRMVGGDLYTYWTLYDGGGDGIRVDLTGRREAISSVPAASYVTVKGVIVLRQDSYSGEWVPVLIPATNGGDVMWYMP